MARGRPSDRREEFEVLEEYLADNGLKNSRQREIILQYFLETAGHMTVDDLYRIIHHKHPEIGRTTIYRSLKLFCDAQLAESIDLKDGLTRFEHRYKHSHHDHMICMECGTIIEFVSPDIEELQDEIAKAYGFTIDSHRHQLFGVCQKCNQQRREADKKGRRNRKKKAVKGTTRSRRSRTGAAFRRAR
ncbi:MAG: Fur family transcriptional regulator [Acidobacteriota bacterium]